MNSEISFILDGTVVSIDFKHPSPFKPTTTVLNYLRSLPTHKGVKEGCAEGDCGACTVVLGQLDAEKKIRYHAVDSCLVFLPMIHGTELITVEELRDETGTLHPVQRSMVETNGSQCGYCTPGIIMSLFSLYKNESRSTRGVIDDALTGNLCRCTGYKPIVEAAARACIHGGIDHFTNQERDIAEKLRTISQGSLTLKSDTQQYFKPASLKEALILTHQLPEAIVICGATDAALRVTKKHELLREIIDLGSVDELQKITSGPSELRIGAAVPLSEVMKAVENEFPALFTMLLVFGSRQIRNLATLGGNLGTASPIGDMLPVLIAYDARVVLHSVDGVREVSLDDFFTGYRQTLRKPNELITEVIVPRLPQEVRVKSYKISKRKDLDISTVCAGFRLELNGGRTVKSVKLAYGGMAERTKRASRTEEFIVGKPWERPTVEEAMKIIDSEFSPISDARGGAEMRRIAARNLLLKFWSETSEV